MARLAKDVRTVSNSDGTIVLHLRRGTMLRVNSMGSKILDLLNEGTSPGEMAAQLSETFGVAREIVEADIAEFLERLQFHGVLDSPTNP
jgi:Coenzyme PQQ synthesis protein D (PqqD)